MSIDARTVRIITQPASEPVSIEEAKEHLRVDHTVEDAFIYGLIVAARIYCEQVSRRAFVTRTYTARLDDWPSDSFELPYGPLQTVTSVKYTDADSIETTYSSSNYLVDSHSEPGRVVLKSSASWPSATLQDINGVEIIWVAGYGDADDVPETYKAAIKLLVGHLFENREAVTVAQGISVVTTPLGLDMLLLTDRLY